jgi:hypothetical protein
VHTIDAIFSLVRRLVVFGLGCWIIGNALVHPDERVSQLLIGMVMVGVLPIENVFSWHARSSDQSTSSTQGEPDDRRNHDQSP